MFEIWNLHSEFHLDIQKLYNMFEILEIISLCLKYLKSTFCASNIWKLQSDFMYLKAIYTISNIFEIYIVLKYLKDERHRLCMHDTSFYDIVSAWHINPQFSFCQQTAFLKPMYSFGK